MVTTSGRGNKTDEGSAAVQGLAEVARDSSRYENAEQVAEAFRRFRSGQSALGCMTTLDFCLQVSVISLMLLLVLMPLPARSSMIVSYCRACTHYNSVSVSHIQPCAAGGLGIAEQ